MKKEVKTKGQVLEESGKDLGSLAKMEREEAKLKVTEEALKQSEQDYEAVVDSIDGIVWEADARSFQFRFVSNQAERLLGYPIRQWLTEPTFWQDHIHPDDRDKTVAFCLKATEERKSHEFEYRMMAADGQPVWLRDIVTVVVEDDQPVRLRGVMVDITERKLAEEALRESEQRYRGLVELSPDAIAVHAEGRVVFANRAAVKLFGARKPEELIGKSILDIVHPDYRELVTKRVQQMMEEGKKVPLVEEKLIRLDGRVVDVEVAAVPINYQNKPAVQVVARDITERKQTENALYEQEERFRKIFEEGQLSMAIVGPNERFLKVNARMCRMFGYMEQELTTLTWKDITHPDDIRVGVKNVEKLLRGEIPYYKAEKRYIKKNGEVLWATLTVSVIRRDDGSIMYRLAMIDDITERKQAEEELKRSEENFKNLFRLSSDAIIIQDKDRNIVDVNTGAERLFGYTKEELINDPEIKLADYEKTDRAAADEYIEKAFGGETQQFEWWGRKKDGTTFPEEVTLNTTIYDGREVIFVTTRDITARKQAEVRLLDYQKQLQSLASELSLAEERERKRIATELHDRIAQSLAFSKIKLGSLREKVSSPNIVQIVEELHEIFEQLIQDTRSLTFELASPILYELGLEKAIEWLAEHVQKESGLCIDFKSDGQDKPLSENARITLFQAVREAMINVAKHAQAQNIRVSVKKVGDGIRIQVVDDGIGFDVAETIPPDARRSGFGLFSVRERIKYLGGNFEVHSNPGLGTRITLNAPLGGEKS